MATPTKTSLENISSRCLHFFAVIPIPSSCTMCSNYPVTERVGTALNLTERMKNVLPMRSRYPQHLEYGHFTLLFGRVRRRNEPKFKGRAGPLFFLIKSYCFATL